MECKQRGLAWEKLVEEGSENGKLCGEEIVTGKWATLTERKQGPWSTMWGLCEEPPALLKQEGCEYVSAVVHLKKKIKAKPRSRKDKMMIPRQRGSGLFSSCCSVTGQRWAG